MSKKILIFGLLSLFLVPVVLAKEDREPAARLKQVKSVETRLCNMYKGRPTEARQNLDGLTKKLDRIKKAVFTAKSKGKDVTGAETLIASAETSLAKAKQAIADFKTTECPTISAGTARADAKTALEALKSNLETVKKALQEANAAIVAAHRALTQIVTGRGDN